MRATVVLLSSWILVGIFATSGSPGQGPRLSSLGEAGALPKQGVYGPTALADFNGDGAPDLLRTDGVVFNDGHGRFSVAGNAPGGLFSTAYFTAVADFDGDGDLDVFAPSSASGVALLLNGGAGVFTAAPIAPPVPGGASLATIYRLVAADLNGDGAMDVVGEYSAGPTFGLCAWLNSGGGTFSVLPFNRPLSCYLVDVGDVDADGRADVVFAEGNLGGPGNVVRSAALASGSLVVSGFLTSVGPNGAIYGAVADWNGDGYADLMATTPVSTSSSNALYTFLPGGASGLGAATTSAITTTFASRILPFDLDAATPAEVLWETPLGIQIHAVNPAGGTVVVATLPHTSYGSSPILTGDVDSDGDIDVIGLTPALRSRVWFNAGGVLVDPSPGLDAALRSVVCAADIDGDGDLDLVGDALTSLEINDGIGHFAHTATQPPVPFLSLPAGCVADFTGDGRADLFVGATQATGNHLVAYVPAGTNWATSTTATSPLFYCKRAVPADIEFDGDADVVVVGDVGPAITSPGATPVSRIDVLNNNGAGSLSQTASFVGHHFTDVAVMDFDGDLDLDIVASCLRATSVPDPSVVALNVGGTFVVTPLPFTVEAATVAAADLDADGDVDLVFDGVAYIRTGSNWTVSPNVAQAPLVGGFSPHDLADLDGDGRPELLTHHGWHIGLGPAGFGPVTPWEYEASFPGAYPFGLTVGDFDRDGDLDVLTSWSVIHWNLRRHLAQQAPVRPGRPGSLSMFGAPGAPYQLVYSSAAAQAPIPVAGWGTIFIDPASAVLVSPAFMDLAGNATLTLPCPNNPALVGQTIWWQAATLNELKLTGAVRMQILGL